MTPRWIWLLPISTALVLRLGSVYEPFPSAEALRTVPAAWTAGSGQPLWTAVIRVSDATGALAGAWWWLTVILAVGAAGGVFRLMRALGVAGFLLPPALAIGSAGIVGALAARSPEGALGTGFGMEPLALCLALWCYDSFVRGHAVRAGALLGAAALAHPLVLAHGLVVLAIATPFTAGRPWRRLGLVAGVALAVGAPAAMQLAGGTVDIAGMDGAAAGRVIKNGYLFRFPNAYTLQGLLWEAGLGRILLALAGIAGAVSLMHPEREPPARALAGLIAGHAALTAAAVLCYTSRLAGPWSQSLAAYALDLTLTSALLPVLSGIAVMAAVESRLVRGRDGVAGPRAFRLTLWAAAATLLVQLDWTPWVLLGTALGLAALAAAVAGRGQSVVAAVLAAAALGALGWSFRRDVRDAPLERQDAELYAWARQASPAGATFIVPPMARSFRYYTRRGAYVDYDFVPSVGPRALRMWRDRLDLVARPDARAGSVPVWRRPYAMERNFALANTPERAAVLLSRVGATYLVWDARGLAIPPHLPVNRPADSRVAEAFRNDRYVVYTLAEAHRGRP